MTSALLCLLALNLQTTNLDKFETRYTTCLAVVAVAQIADVDPYLAVSVAWFESKFNPDAVSSAGAVGPLQVLPKYWCPERRLRGCNLLEAGARALQRYTRKYALREALCRYNAGGRGCKVQRAAKYADRVLRMQKRLRNFERAGICP